MVTASLTQSSLPVTGDPAVWAEITRPDGTSTTRPLEPDGDDEYATTFATTVPGVYRVRVRVRARGRTRAGPPFTRERTVTATVWRGSDDPAGPGRPGGRRHDPLCRLLSCLLGPGGAIDDRLVGQLRRLGVDLDEVRRCVADCCGGNGDRDDG